MTREEAITVLKGLSDNPLFSDQHRAAFNIAIHDIKAHHDWDINNLILINKDNYEPLEQEPTTPNDCETCIHNQGVLECDIYGCKYEPTTKNDLGVDREDAVERLNALKQLIGYDKDSEIVKATQKSLDMAIKALEQEPRWVPVKFRPLTDEEQDEYPDYCYMADCPMPDDGEEILVCTAHGGVEKDECLFEDGFYLDSGYDWQTDIIAWMPLPEPYRAESEAEDGNN